ncbi:MAG: hypothetical protein J7604_06980 [Sporocytophaga sp.]|uniref:hypothetical protein n=1 Tax=Sporocytophaga sp. TaxID=2231183 RepID=UPI001AFE81B9|nr:hypothetical protein [Sporocytophaga sp.]MBO9699936.1 hypothetical protein [Sporocytophaga sp.]
MKPEHLAIIKQLIKEFWIQLVLSIAWSVYTVYNASERSDVISIFIKNFGTSFFLLSWFFGQFIRVKKQKKTENSFEELKTKTEELIKQLEQATTKTIGNLTGGNSFPIIKLASFPAIIEINKKCTPVIFIEVEGDFPVFDVEVVILYYSIPEYSISDERKTIEILHKQTFVKLEKVPSFTSMENLKVVAHITTRNGSFIQKLRMDIVDERLMWATRTFKFMGKGSIDIIHEEKHPKYNEMTDEAIFGTGTVDFKRSKNLTSSHFSANHLH